MKNVMQLSDDVYLEGIRNQNEKVLSALYKLHFSAIAGFVINNNGTVEEAKDIYQEAFMIFYQKVLEGNLNLTCQIKTFLYSICRKLWLQKLYQKKRFAGQVLETERFIETESLTEECIEQEKRFEVMEQALVALGEPCRTLLEDFYFANLSMDDISGKFGYTNTDTAKNQKYKCLQRLKKLFFNSNHQEL